MKIRKRGEMRGRGVRVGKILQRVRVRSNKGETEVIALFDSGASRTLIREDVARRIGDAVKLPVRREFILADGVTKINVKEIIAVVIIIDGYVISCDADVVEVSTYDLIIGINTMREWGIVIDMMEAPYTVMMRRMEEHNDEELEIEKEERRRGKIELEFYDEE